MTKNWNTNRINKFEEITKDFNNGWMSIERVDRTIDSYLACVVHNDILVNSGLFPTLASARKHCENIAKSLDENNSK